jgi:transposase
LKRKPSKSRRMSQQKIVYIGADLHERETQLAVFEPSGSLVMERRIPTSDLKSFIGSLPGDEKHVAIEAVGFVYPIYDALSRLPNCHVSVANPSSVQLIARSRLKHDRADARVLGELLRTNFLPLSHIPGQETREERSLIRDRVRYGLRGGEIKTSIRWLLKRRGISGFEKPFSVEGRKELRELKLDEIDMRLDELELAESFIGRLDWRIEGIVANNPKARLLDTLPGVAPYTALFLSSTLDDVDRFPDSKHACAYLGLVPSLNQSGDKVQLGHITKEGNNWLRRNLTECARVAVRKDPHLREFYLKLKHKRGERKALIAVARKLASYAYWMLKRNVTYEELAPWTASWGQQESPPSE